MTAPIKTEDDLMLAVWHGRMSIEEGVAWGLQHGYPFIDLPASDIAAFKNAVWTIEQAIGWIAWRTDEGGARAGALLRYWGRPLLDAPPEVEQRESLPDAKNLLWDGLIGGTVIATGLPARARSTR